MTMVHSHFLISYSSPTCNPLLFNHSFSLSLSHTHTQTPSPISRFPFPFPFAFAYRSISVRNALWRRASTSEETSSGTNPFFDEKRDGPVVVDDVKPDVKSSFNETEDNQKELLVEEQGLSLDFLDKLNLKFDVDDTGSLVVYGGGAIVALWLTSAIIGAIDSIPLLPKLLEVVGLGYTVWFTSRYLLFKRNRDELVAKIEELKEQVLGSEDK